MKRFLINLTSLQQKNVIGLLVICQIIILLISYKLVSKNENFTFNRENQSEKLKLRNWFDYTQVSRDVSRKGLGELGAHVYLTDLEEIERNEKLYQETGFSVLVSDKISVNRSILPIVHPDCAKIEYYAKLPKTSVIVIFHNEVKSVLLRTIHSIVNRTPPELLHEIIMVNDKSSNDELYEPLQDYVAKNFPKKVKIKNLDERHGLIRTRMEGARAATGEVLVFFDSHVEVQPNWLPPLLQPIVDNPRTATLPIVDYFLPDTFGYIEGQEGGQGTRGIIDWFLDFHEVPKLPQNYGENNLKPFPNPVMLGCAFAINRKFFIEDLGGYDEGLEIWNGENYELSFKLWMCAEGLFTVPCSRVGHSFRSINPSRKRKEDYVAKNFMRIAEVWLDEFKDLPRQLEPERYADVSPGNITHQKALREKLKCKSFRWFLDEIAPEILNIYAPVADLPRFASGTIRSIRNPKFCLESLGESYESTLGLTECRSKLEPLPSQQFTYTFFKDIRQIYDHGRHQFCLDSYKLNFASCNQLDYGNQYWIYDKDTTEISYSNPDKKCLTYEVTDSTLSLKECSGEMKQKWKFSFINETAYEKFNNIFGYSSVF